MKVLQINNVHYKRGGADAVYLNTAELLQEHGDEVVFFNMRKTQNLPCKDDHYWVSSIETRPKGLKSTLIELRNFFYNPEAKKKIEELILAEKPDIAHIHLFWGCGISPSITSVLKQYNIPLVQSVHDYRMICPIALMMDRKGRVCERCRGKHFYKACIYNCSHHGQLHSILMSAEMYFHNLLFYPTKVVNGFIYVSQFARDKHIEYMPKMRDANKTVLYNFAPSSGKYTRASSDDYYLYYGRLSYEKGIRTLLNAIKNNPKIILKVVGTGPLRDELVNDFGKYPNILFLGYKSGIELQNLVRSAKYVCVPSEWYENNPMTIVEAYSMGTPVIGAHIGGIPEIIEEDKTGFCFESGNELDLTRVINLSTAKNPSEYDNMRRSAFSFYINHFSPESHYHKLISFYKQTINHEF